jgi:predicted lipid-binding transport protein (Tim44 family)
MRNILACCLIMLLSFGLVVQEASAKRFGSGRSFGIQRSSSSFSSNPTRSYSTASSNYGRNTQATPNRWGKWGGMLGGLVAGGLLASLFMGHGVGSGLLSWLFVGLAVYVALSFFRRFMQPNFQSAASNTAQPNTFNPAFNNHSFNNSNHAANSTNWSSADVNNHFLQNGGNNYPVDFIQEDFLNDAREKFMRLQRAFDQQNISDLSSFTTPEMFSEVKLQLQERGNELNRTEIIALDAELLDVSKQFDSLLASVRFTGSLKENNDPATQLNEIWHFCRYVNTNKWVVAGVQQNIVEPRY